MHRTSCFESSKCVPAAQSVIVEHAARATHISDEFNPVVFPGAASDGQLNVPVPARCVSVLHITLHDSLDVRVAPTTQRSSGSAEMLGIRPLAKATSKHEFGVQPDNL